MPDTKLTLEEYNALIAQCGCCEAPLCCPPEIECMAMVIHFDANGYVDQTQGSDPADGKLYLKEGWTGTRIGSATGGDLDGKGPAWSASINSTYFHGYAHTRYYRGGVQGAAGGSGSSDDCPWWPPETPEENCTKGGNAQYITYALHYYGEGPEYEYTYGPAVSTDSSLQSAEGETTEEFAAWRAQYPTDADYDAAVADYETDYAAWVAAGEDYDASWDAYVEAWDAWDLGGQVGPEPEEPTLDPPGPAPQPPAERPEEFYGPCDFKLVENIEVFITYRGKQSDGTYPPSWTQDDAAVQAWIDAGMSGDPSNYGSGTRVTYGYDSNDHPPTPLTSGQLTTDTVEFGYADGITEAEWVVLVQGVIDSIAWSDDCVFHTPWCHASRELFGTIGVDSGSDPGRHEFAVSLREIWTKYRIKLDKCCPWRSIKSRWQQVFYPAAWLDWLALSGGSDPPPEPDPGPSGELQAWSWTGVPPGCPEDSGSGGGSASEEPQDHFDHQPMWSPLSPVIKVPAGSYGEVWQRNYQQKCYGGLWHDMPEVMGEWEGEPVASDSGSGSV